MRQIFLLGSIFTCLLVCVHVFGQSIRPEKSPLDTSDFKKWPSIEQPQISGNGKYVCYIVKVGITERGRYNGKPPLLNVASSDGSWRKEFDNVSQATFSADSRKLYLIKGDDSLGTFDLKSNQINFLPNVNNFTIGEKGAFIAWRMGQNLTVENTTTGETRAYSNVIDYRFTDSGQELLIQINAGGVTQKTLEWVDLKMFSVTDIWHGNRNAGQYTFDNSGKKLAFTVSDGDGSLALFYYAIGNKGAIELTMTGNSDMNGFAISNRTLQFSRDGDRLLVSVRKSETPQITKPAIQNIVEIWRYDALTKLMLSNLKTTQDYHAIVDLNTKKIIRVVGENEHILNSNSFEKYFLLELNSLPLYRLAYDRPNYPDYYLLSVETGQRKLLVAKQNPWWRFQILSPRDHYALWFDKDSLSLYCYETSTGKTRNISSHLPFRLYYRGYPDVLGRSAAAEPYGIVGWSADDRFVYLYDNWDIWKVDLKDEISPVNITHGEGQKHGLVFSLFLNGADDKEMLHPKEKLLLAAFSPETKDNGFWELRLESRFPPEELSRGQYLQVLGRPTELIGHDDLLNNGVPGFVTKATDANTWLLSRQRADSFPNLYVTNDFKIFKPISDLRPEKNYNWLTSELVTWQLPDGQYSQGILYKPENIDPAKKYPILFEYYATFSRSLNLYPRPDWNGGRIDIPYYVSNGYLVFVPDMHYIPGHNGQGIVNTVVSAAHFLSQRPYIDSTKMGLQGHSWGGYETAYLVTHTHLFAAACAASGMYDLISDIDSHPEGVNYYYDEVTTAGAAYGIGVLPWTRPDIYVEDTPIFSIGNVTTPTLLSDGDADLNFSQAIEFFMGLQRAGKKSWLLQYKGAGHYLLGEKSAKDLTVRMKQFFDYYLKGAPPPVWMAQP